ncbi:hypothetical protein AMEX_G4423 [Astyanax mexicanus]|uniref:Uncharacterized protein n=1 Tax=Astyanax mexicanus TaxID=7994 RepID=A0A8T2M3S3_ASTMX|nr:hypothetical protein AMEX_G4423 [Astyanax mexicanus]
MFCCCCPRSSTEEETEPLLGAPGSARQHHLSQPNGSEQKHGEITARRVGVPDLDERFADVEVTFNKQYEDYKQMEDRRKTLLHRYRCSPGDSLSKCLKKIKDEHDTHHIQLQLKGYDFSLAVTPEDTVPDKLKRTQENVRELSQAAIAVVSVGTKLQELASWILKKEKTLIQQVTEAAPTHQEKQRLVGNLQENLREVSRAKEQSLQYRVEAEKLLNEADLLSGVTP